MTNNDFLATPNLTGKNISVRELLAADKEEIYLAFSDPLIWEQHPKKNHYKREQFEQWFEQALNEQALAIYDNKHGQLIGSSRYYEASPEQSHVAIGYTFLIREHWGGETNAELKKLMINHAREHFDTIWLHIASENMRSRKAAEKIGAVFSHEG